MTGRNIFIFLVHFIPFPVIIYNLSQMISYCFLISFYKLFSLFRHCYNETFEKKSASIRRDLTSSYLQY